MEIAYKDGAVFKATLDPDYERLHQSWQACLEHSRKVTLFSYDNNGRVSTKYILTKENGSQLATRLDYTYDRLVLSAVEGQDNLTQLDVSHEGETYHYWYDYDDRGLQLTQKSPPTPGTLQNKYDKNGNLRFSQDANQPAAGKVTFTT